MNNHFTHFVLTRFNVRFGPNVSAPDDAWLRHRLGLFERFPVASMRAQTCPSFRWLVFVDDSSPDWLRAELGRLLSDARFRVVSGRDFEPSRAVAQACGELAPTPFVLTTRLDNDDAVARDFVATVQERFEEAELGFLNFLNGVQLYRANLYRKSDPSNAFLTLTERSGSSTGPKTVYCTNHELASDVAPVRQIAGAPMWLQVIHGRNLANRPRGVRSAKSTLLQRFDLPADSRVSPTISFRFLQAVDAFRLAARVMTRPATARKAYAIAQAELRSRCSTQGAS